MSHFNTLRQPGIGWPRGLLFACLLIPIGYAAQAQVVADTFDRPDNNFVGNGWMEHETTAPQGAIIATDQLVMKSDGTGREFVSRPTPGTYVTTLSNNTCVMQWSFNMSQTRLDPSGFNVGGYGIAVVLAGSNADLLQGSGYAVVLGTANSTTDRLRLVRYTGGLGQNTNLTNIIAAGDFGNELLDVRVTFEPTSGMWRMFYMNRGNGPYGDATSASAIAGFAIDNTYTGINLPNIGCFWNHPSSTTDRGRFDSFRVPYDCSSRVGMTMTSGTIGSNAGTYAIGMDLTNPSTTNDTYVDLVLVSGNSSRIAGFESGTVHFPAGGEVNKYLVLTITEDGACDGDDDLVFQLQNISGGQGTPFIGPPSTFALHIVDEEVTPVVLLTESFETDGNGTRYALNAVEGSPAFDSYLLRSNVAGFTPHGGMNVTQMQGTSYIGGENMGAVAPNAEAIVTFNAVDILGLSDANASLLVGARLAPNYDQAMANRDYIYVETNVDGAGWTTIGAFRAQGVLMSSNNTRLALDSDLNGIGDGAPLSTALQPYTFHIPQEGSTMQMRVRFRSTSASEELYIDDVQVNGSLCRQVYYSNASGNAADPIWSTLRSGPVTAVDMDKNTSLVVQAGHDVTGSGMGMVARNVTVESGGVLDMSAATIDVHGDHITNHGAFTFSTGHLHVVGTEAVVIDGVNPFELHDVTLSDAAGVTTTAAMNIRGSLVLEQGDLNATNGAVTLVSTADGTGRLGPVPPTASYTGNLKVERYIPGGNTNWRLIGSPVSNNTVLNWQDDFYTAGYPGSQSPSFYSPVGSGILWPSVRWYNEPNPGAQLNDGVVGVPGSNQPLPLGRGFAAWSGDNLVSTAPFVIDLTGAPHIAYAPITLPMTWTNTGHPAVDGYNLVCNPLPSAIDFEQVTLGADVDHVYSINNPVTGTMATWNGTVGINGANGVIQSSQGFWLKAHGPAVTTTVSEAAKVADNGGGVFGGKDGLTPSMVRLQLTSTVNSFSDETLVIFSEGSPEFNGDDVPKYVFAHPLAPQLATQGEMGQWIAINAYGPYATDITIPVIVDVAVSGTYTVTATEMLSIGLSCLSIEDVVTGTITPLNAGAGYSFSSNATDDANVPRLLLHATAPLVLVPHDATCAGRGNGSATVELTGASTDITWSIDGGDTLLQENALAAGVTTSPDLSAGDYLVTLSSSPGCGSLTQFFEINEPAALEVTMETTNASCPGVSDGTIDLEVMGGVAPYTYLWSDNSTIEDLAAIAGTYAVTVTDANECVLASSATTIGTDAGPTAVAGVVDTNVPVNTPVTFTNESMANGTVLWDFADGTTSTEDSPEHSFSLPGMYEVSLTVQIGGCSASTTILMNVEATTGLVTSVGPSLNAWVSGDRIIVEHTITNGMPVRVEILNASGQLFTQYDLSGHPGRTNLPMDGMTAGIWFLRVTNDRAQRTFALPVID